MGVYLKQFENHTHYESFTVDTENFITPNVSLCVQENEVHYNPYVDPYNGHAYVDLDLPSGTKWAKYNVGANSETDYGLYFSWGNIEGHKKASGYDFSKSTYSSTSGNRYNRVSVNISANSDYDAARVNMGGKWRMPTKDEFQELYDNTDSKWTHINDVYGYMFMKKTDHSVYVFFPAAGYYNGTGHNYNGSYGYYWSSVLYSTESAYSLRFSSAIYTQENKYRYYGSSVRGVIDK